MAQPNNPFQTNDPLVDPLNQGQQTQPGQQVPPTEIPQPQAPTSDYQEPQPFDTFQGYDQPAQPINTQFDTDYVVDPNQQQQVQDFSTQDYTQDYTQDFTQDYTQEGFDQYQNPPIDPNQQTTPSSSPVVDNLQQGVGNAAIPPQSAAADTTFEETQGGNRIFYIIIGSIIVVLVLAVVTLFALNIFNNDSSDDTSDTSTPTSQVTDNQDTQEPSQPEPINNTITGGDNTPATLARVNSDTQAPNSWFQQYFTAPFIDSQGNCLTVSFCDLQADPDSDGLTNIQEFNFDTDPQINDTDQDGIADGDETFRYFTSPRSKDSDGDTFEDIDELLNCFDPALVSDQKMTAARLEQLSSNISIQPLREPTGSELIKGGASNTDVQIRGYRSVGCPVVDDTPADDTTTDQN